MEPILAEEYSHSEQSNNSIERNGDIATIQTTEGIYHLVYGIHTTEHTPDYSYLSGTDGVCYEGVYSFGYPKSYGELAKSAGTKNQTPFFQYAATKRIPIYATDVYIPDELFAGEQAIYIIEAIIGGLLINKAKVQKSKGVSRRNFILNTTSRIGKVGLGLYLAYPIGSGFFNLGTQYAQFGVNDSLEASKWEQRIHPETNIFELRVRDLVVAQKLHYLLLHGIAHDLTVPRGSEHVDIEDHILEGEEGRLDELEKIQWLLRQLGTDFRNIVIKDTFYMINKYEYLSVNKSNGQYSWRLTGKFEDPSLRKIFDK